LDFQIRASKKPKKESEEHSEIQESIYPKGNSFSILHPATSKKSEPALTSLWLWHYYFSFTKENFIIQKASKIVFFSENLD
jgi:hypothetical protein